MERVDNPGFFEFFHLKLVRCCKVREYKGHKVDPPDNKVVTSKDELMSMFELMYKMRRMEIASDQMYKAKFIRGFCHL